MNTVLALERQEPISTEAAASTPEEWLALRGIFPLTGLEVVRLKESHERLIRSAAVTVSEKLLWHLRPVLAPIFRNLYLGYTYLGILVLLSVYSFVAVPHAIFQQLGAQGQVASGDLFRGLIALGVWAIMLKIMCNEHAPILGSWRVRPYDTLRMYVPGDIEYVARSLRFEFPERHLMVEYWGTDPFLLLKGKGKKRIYLAHWDDTEHQIGSCDPLASVSRT